MNKEKRSGIGGTMDKDQSHGIGKRAEDKRIKSTLLNPFRLFHFCVRKRCNNSEQILNTMFCDALHVE